MSDSKASNTSTQESRFREEFLDWMKKNSVESDFFQVARLLFMDVAGHAEHSPKGHAFGLDQHLEEESFRFRALPSLSHPANEVQIQSSSSGNQDGSDQKSILDVIVTFMGLTGPSGVLPHHYTETLCDRIRNHDFALRDFLDLFNHRLITLFFHAWKKYRLPFSFEFSHLDKRTGQDSISACIQSLVGMNTGGLRDRQEFSDSAFCYYGGAFSSQHPNGVELESIIKDHFGVEAQLYQFQPDVLLIEKDEQTRLGVPSVLGETTIVGERVTTFESRFRICVGPCNIDEFNSFTPVGSNQRVLGQFIRSYVGVSYDFDLQVVLRKEDVPDVQLGGSGESGSHLGWNTWMNSMPARSDALEAVFSIDGSPSR